MSSARAAARRLAARLSAFSVACLTACAPTLDAPPTPAADPTEAWGRRLAEVVSEAGDVDYAALRADPTALRDFLGWTAVHGPETDGMRLTDDNTRLAWHLNVVNAWVLWTVVDGAPLTREPADSRIPFAWVRLPIDSEHVLLDRHLVHTVLATYEEPLAAAALACGARSCPPAPRALYVKEGLARALSRQMKRWLTSGRLLRGDGTTFVFSPALRPYLPAFQRWSGAATPCEAVAPYAEPALRARLEACPDWRWGEWDGTIDGVVPG